MTTVHVAVFDTLADWEIGYLCVELATGRFTGTPVDLVTVGPTTDPVTTMGGLTVLPDRAVTDLDPAGSGLLVLPGSGFWDADDGRGTEFVTAAGRFLEAGTPVAAICGATAALARAGLLDHRDHTSAAPEYLAATGYAGAARYRDDRVVTDRDLITAGPQSPAHFAAAILGRLGLMSPERRRAYVGVFVEADPAAYVALDA